ncbi:MAG: DUF4258 domain-containing protein [Tepidibacillus sp.]
MIVKNHLYGKLNWMKEQQQFVSYIRKGGQVKFTSHFWDSMSDRSVSIGDVYGIFKNGTAEIIQGHAIGTYSVDGGKLNEDELRVFYGKAKNGTIIHVVVAIENLNKKKFKFVTVYIPSPVYFESDMKTLKKKWQFRIIK